MSAKELPKSYNPKDHEENIYRLWMESGYFAPEARDVTNGGLIHGKPFTIALPPPNITGSLHMGHALNATIQDILVRWKRMEGCRALWIPGTDHAGIATQNVVEKELKKEGKTRQDLGREKFIERVWAWREQYGGIILDQLKKLGASCDWVRARFTMDEEYVKAVEAAFVHYYEKGWIYKGVRVVSWCTRCQTSLSDLEVEYRDEEAKLSYITYGPLTLATVRPETKLGDTALAVNPHDPRYTFCIGKTLEVESVSTEGTLEKPEREKIKIRVVADQAVDPGFGTGVVKVTPAHDATDFEIAERHNAPLRQVIDKNGFMNENAGKYKGLKVAEARKKISDDLRALGLLQKEELYPHRVAVCYRCSTVIEPLPSEQWFVKMDSLAKMALEAVEEQRIKFHPQRWQKIYTDWLKDVKDWCISRQIWWGHRLPVWYCGGLEKALMHHVGFYEGVVPQVLGGKTRIYRLRDHSLRVGDRVVFENTQTRTVFGFAVITAVEHRVIRDIALPDPAHGGGYQTTPDLIAAFKKHYPPEREIDENTTAIIYNYQFEPVGEKHAGEGCGQVYVGHKTPSACRICGGKNFAQDTDVLDTWFSSALWPFAILGWPVSTKASGSKPSDLELFYPTQVLSTARDIINLWVSRMVFSGVEFMGREPFSDVIIHATVLAKDGKRMSKSLGTGVDPMKLIEAYGADATRFGLMWMSLGGQDLKFGEEPILAGKKFLNKIWNASRFVLQKTGGALREELPEGPKLLQNAAMVEAAHDVMKSVTKYLEAYEFGQALHAAHEFFWHTFCDDYIEWAKKQDDDETKHILGAALVISLKLLHPFIPFATEAAWRELRKKEWPEFLMIAEWPKTQG